MVEFLLSNAKVDASQVNKHGKTAAELADFWGSTEAIAVFDRLAPNKNRVQHSVGSPFAPPPSTSSPSANPMAAGAGLVAGTQKLSSTSNSSSIAEWWNKWSVKELNPIQFTGATHNRSSFLRTDKEYLQESVQSPTTRFVIFADHGVLFKSSTRALAFVTYEDIKHLLGSDPVNNLPDGLVLAFLGVDETGNAQPQQEGEVLVRGRRGVGYWALDLSARNSTQDLKDAIETWTNTYTEKHGHYMAEMRPAAFGLTYQESGLVAQARSVVDWNKRNQFCAGCGRKNLSLEGGHKRSCPPTLTKDGEEVPSDCLAHRGVQNFTYPRTGESSSFSAISGSFSSIFMSAQVANA